MVCTSKGLGLPNGVFLTKQYQAASLVLLTGCCRMGSGFVSGQRAGLGLWVIAICKETNKFSLNRKKML